MCVIDCLQCHVLKLGCKTIKLDIHTKNVSVCFANIYIDDISNKAVSVDFRVCNCTQGKSKNTYVAKLKLCLLT